MAFADEFRAHVVPMLALECRKYGFLIAGGLRTWSEGYATIHRAAIERGALHLTDAQHEKLTDWIASKLLEACAVAEPEWDEAGRVADKVATQLRRHMAAVASLNG